MPEKNCSILLPFGRVNSLILFNFPLLPLPASPEGLKPFHLTIAKTLLIKTIAA